MSFVFPLREHTFLNALDIAMGDWLSIMFCDFAQTHFSRFHAPHVRKYIFLTFHTVRLLYTLLMAILGHWLQFVHRLSP